MRLAPQRELDGLAWLPAPLWAVVTGDDPAGRLAGHGLINAHNNSIALVARKRIAALVDSLARNAITPLSLMADTTAAIRTAFARIASLSPVTSLATARRSSALANRSLLPLTAFANVSRASSACTKAGELWSIATKRSAAGIGSVDRGVMAATSRRRRSSSCLATSPCSSDTDESPVGASDDPAGRLVRHGSADMAEWRGSMAGGWVATNR